MTRSRKISTDISTDVALRDLAERFGDFPVLLYTWMIPHAKDDGILYGSAEEVRCMVIPGRRDKTEEDVDEALNQIASIKQEVRTPKGKLRSVPLIQWDVTNGRVVFPAASFYRYQSYVPVEHRRADSSVGEFAESSEEVRRTPTDEDFKVMQVCQILPTGSSPNAQEIVRTAVRKESWVDVDDLVQIARYVLDRFNANQHKNRTDWATLFARRLEWWAEEHKNENAESFQPLDDILALREYELEASQRNAAESVEKNEWLTI